MSDVLSAEQYLTQAQLAEIAGENPRVIRRWLDEGKIGYVRFPRERRIPQSEWEKFVAARTVSVDEEDVLEREHDAKVKRAATARAAKVPVESPKRGQLKLRTKPAAKPRRMPERGA